MVRELLVAGGLRRAYPRPSVGLMYSGAVIAVDGVDLKVDQGASLGLVGESGSGKSTLARLLLVLERPDVGFVDFAGRRISEMSQAALRPLRRRFQAVFQDPVTSLNPRLRVSTIISEPLVAHRIGDRSSRPLKVEELLRLVGLPPDVADRRPAEFSGGERQRIAIARALAPNPDLLILDEPLTALDVSVQRQILGILAGLRDQLELSLVLISHDLNVVQAVCDKIAVMFRGVIVEQGSTHPVLTNPQHPYTRTLVASAPGSKPPLSTDERGGPARSWPAGACRYASRCAHADNRCHTEPPLLNAGDRHRVACWLIDRDGGALSNGRSNRR